MFHNGWSVKKLDGVRGIWNGEKLHFRSGKWIYALKWFTENFLAQPMDGELWMGRGTFDRLSGIVLKKIPDERDWKQMLYMLFELPESSGTFTERIQNCEIDSLSKNPLATGYSANRF
jgi:DNA ligase-1